jgi:hypothetical protein
MSGGQCLDGSPPRKLRSVVITILHNSHYSIETSIMINQSGLDTVPPFLNINNINFFRNYNISDKLCFSHRIYLLFIYLFIYLFIEDFNK